MLWAHYASSFKGIAIEFDESNIFFDKFKFDEVNYDSNRALDKNEPYKELLFKKHPSWEYEKEKRMLIDIVGLSQLYPCELAFKVKRETIKKIEESYGYMGDDYLADILQSSNSISLANYSDAAEVFTFVKVSFDSVKAIYIGAYMPIEEQVELKQLVNNKAPNCKIYRTYPCENSYGLVNKEYDEFPFVCNWL